MSDDNSIEERKVATHAISKSFKGILRVSNVKETGSTPDVYLNPDYYGEFKPTPSMPVWEPVGEQSTEAALSGENDRYAYEDKYTLLKLPVTDSLGNCLNFSLGVDGSLIGTDATTGTLNDTTIDFYTLETDSLTIGLESRVLKENKDAVGGTLCIENLEIEPASIIVNSYYHHGDSDKEGIFTPSEKPIKVIYKSTQTPKVNDGFVFNQESVIRDENGEHCIVKLKNIRDYIFDKVSTYIKYNSSELPPGTILNQYCSLEKWYCSSNGTIDDLNNWQGFRPSLGNPSPGTTSNESASAYAVDNINQNTYTGDVEINFPTINTSKELVELPPDFKRGYVLADGSSYQITLKPPYLADTTTYNNSKLSIDTFFRLFFTIGYYYTPEPRFIAHRYYEPAEAPVSFDSEMEVYSYPTEGRYYYDYNDPAGQNYGTSFHSNSSLLNSMGKEYFEPISKETLYGVHIATILAFKKFCNAYTDKTIFNKYIRNEQGYWDIEKSIQWLATQSIEEEYIFNTVFSDESIAAAKNINPEINNIIYKHTAEYRKETENGESVVTDTFGVKVGKEISTFSDSIEYYTFELNKKGKMVSKKVYCPIYKTAEIYDLARLFAIKDAAWSAYTFAFNVPKTYTSEDLDVNKAAMYSASGSTIESGKKVGLFFGSTGTVLAGSMTIPSKDPSVSSSTVITDIDNSYTYTQSNCIFNIGYQPHSHAIAKGSLYLDPSRHKYKTGAKPVYLQNVDTEKTNVIKDAKLLKDLEKNNVLAADFTWDASKNSGTIHYSDAGCHKKDLSNKGILNYFLQEQNYSDNVKLREVYNSFNGTMGYELAVFNSNGTVNNNMEWYARTSGPIWDANPVKTGGSQSQKYTEGNSAGYFRPQSVKILPLIKL